MDNQNYNLPWGFTFNPTDEELICYLEAKATNFQLPFADPIVEFDVFTAAHPSQLHMQQRLNASSTHLYFYVKKSGRHRSAGNGYWNASTGPTAILSHEGAVIGHRRLLVYHNSKKRERSSSTKTKWIMNEYRLPDPPSTSASSSKVPIWTICKIGETGRTFGVDHIVPSQDAHLPQQQQLQFHNMELVAPQAHYQQLQFEEQLQQCDGDDLEVPQQCGAQQHQQQLVLPDQDDCNVPVANLIGKFNSCMEMVKERGQRIEQQSDDEDEDEVPLKFSMDDPRLEYDEEVYLLCPTSKRRKSDAAEIF